MGSDEWQRSFENTHKAVCAFARIEIDGLKRRVIHRLQRIDASGIYGDDYAYKSLWDEYCHEVQEGPHDQLESAWKMTIEPLLDDVVERIPRHAAVLLSIFATWELGEEDDPDCVGSVWSDGLKRLLQGRLAEQAGTRNLHRFGRWRNH